MRRVQLTPTCRTALAAHQREADAQARAWFDSELVACFSDFSLGPVEVVWQSALTKPDATVVLS